LAVDDLSVLRDRRVNAGAAFGFDEFGLWHGVWIFAAVIHGFEAKAGPVQVRILRALRASALRTDG
jgi:hypothetical protein